MSELHIPSEARERMMGVLVWGWLNAHRPDVSVEAVAEQALRAMLSYIDEHCPEWYGHRWLRRDELEQVRRALDVTLDEQLTHTGEPEGRPRAGMSLGEGIAAYDKIARALASAA